MMAPTAADEPPSRIFVISDVHVGAGELDDFVPALEERLISFLGVLTSLPQTVELVINGDFFDFATAAPWNDPQLEGRTSSGLPLCFTEAQSRRKLDNVVADHGTVFDALARLLVAKPANRITMLPGNHDADLFWPRVRKGIVDRLSLGAPGAAAAVVRQFRFVLERQLVVERDGQRYWIEHGHQHDPPNSFFPNGQERWSEADPPTFRDTQGHRRLYECPGTLGLVRHINHWRPTYRSISYIKPYSKVLRALIEHKAFAQPGRPLMVLRHMVAMLGWDVDLQTALSAEDDLLQSCHNAVLALVQSLTPAEEAEFVSLLEAGGIKLDISIREYVRTSTRRQRVIDHFAREAGAAENRSGLQVSESTLGLVFGGLVDDAETKALVQMAQRLIQEKKAEYVLTGHTHSPCQKLHGRFSNGGCWIPNQVVDTKASAVDAIFEHGPIDFRLSYLEIRKPGPPRLRFFSRGSIRV